MIKLENYEVMGWEHAIRGMRNPLNSWQKSDSLFFDDSKGDLRTISQKRQKSDFGFMELGENDHELMMKLRNAGTDHRKFMRMIAVYVDITAPLYWLAELDTYKIGTVRNSCSFMHKGVSEPFVITDFSIKDERVYKVLTPIKKKTYKLTYPYETDEFKKYTDHNGHSYKVYKNGKVIREAFDYVDSWGKGRVRHFEEKEATVYQNANGYFIVKLSGRNGGHVSLHRLVAEIWCDKPNGSYQVNHIDGNKGNNSAENLEWVSASSNIQHGIENGLYDELGGIHQRYRLWKHWVRIIPIHKRWEFRRDAEQGLTYKQLADKWDITPEQANNLRYDLSRSENEDLFQECYVWEQIIEQLNYLRTLYLETKDEQIFQSIRALLPQGYMQRSTYMLNYEVLANIYKSRKAHRLDEWRELCAWIEGLPYSELITGEVKE